MRYSVYMEDEMRLIKLAFLLLTVACAKATETPEAAKTAIAAPAEEAPVNPISNYKFQLTAPAGTKYFLTTIINFYGPGIIQINHGLVTSDGTTKLVEGTGLDFYADFVLKEGGPLTYELIKDDVSLGQYFSQPIDTTTFIRNDLE